MVPLRQVLKFAPVAGSIHARCEMLQLRSCNRARRQILLVREGAHWPASAGSFHPGWTSRELRRLPLPLAGPHPHNSVMDPEMRRLTRKYSILSAVTSIVTHPVPAVDEVFVIPIHYYFSAKVARAR